MARPEGKRGREGDRLRKRLQSSVPPKPDPAALAAEAKAEMRKRLEAEEAGAAQTSVVDGWEYVAAEPAPPVSAAELEQIVDFMNADHIDDLLEYVGRWTEVGEAVDKANAFSRGSMRLEREGTTLLAVSRDGVLTVRSAVRKTSFLFNKETVSSENCEVDIREVLRTTDAKGKKAPPKYDAALSPRQALEKAEAELAARGPMSADELKRGFMALSRRCGRTDATGNMMLMPVGDFRGVLPDDLWLNDGQPQTHHPPPPPPPATPRLPPTPATTTRHPYHPSPLPTPLTPMTPMTPPNPN